MGWLEGDLNSKYMSDNTILWGSSLTPQFSKYLGPGTTEGWMALC